LTQTVAATFWKDEAAVAVAVDGEWCDDRGTLPVDGGRGVAVMMMIMRE